MRAADPGEDPRFLELLDGVVTRHVEGKTNLCNARGELHDGMVALGYQSFFDELRASRPPNALNWTEDEFWMNRAINLNFSLRCQRARWLRGQKVCGVGGISARRLDFLKGCNVEAWKQKWDAARAKTTTEGSTDSTLCIALLNHPIWTALSEFGLPYPPFDWDFDGCGSVDLRLVGFGEARDLGIIPGKASSPQHRAMMQSRETE